MNILKKCKHSKINIRRQNIERHAEKETKLSKYCSRAKRNIKAKSQAGRKVKQMENYCMLVLACI